MAKNKPKKKPKYNQNSTIRGALRRAFARSPFVLEKQQESRREVPRYCKDGSRHKKNAVQRQCEICGNWVSSSQITIDHINPVVDIEEGFIDWNEFISRLWCDKSNLQRACDDCHSKKTHKEQISRLLKQYHQELKVLESTVNCDWTAYQIDVKLLNKNLSKYSSKKKTPEFKQIVEWAQRLKNQIKNKTKKRK
jgi:5-methylcytosine-specific restriction endonuclease McrA